MTKPADKWMQKARSLRMELHMHPMAYLPVNDKVLARALEATDTAAMEAAAHFVAIVERIFQLAK